MQDESFPVPSRDGCAMCGEESPALLQRRFDAALACMNAIPIDLPWKFLAEFAPMLQWPTLRDLPVPQGEVPFLQELLGNLARGLDVTDSTWYARCLAAAMFYFMPHELPLTLRPSQLPMWIRVPYLKWSLALPSNSNRSGESGRYARWLAGWLEALTVEFHEGGLDFVPEYQRTRFRRQVVEQLELLQISFHPDHLRPDIETNDKAIESALRALVLPLKEGLAPQPAALR